MRLVLWCHVLPNNQVWGRKKARALSPLLVASSLSRRPWPAACGSCCFLEKVGEFLKAAIILHIQDSKIHIHKLEGGMSVMLSLSAASTQVVKHFILRYSL